eukprot:CAMPEP_0182563018 /NCGR_PEP_ID=MMETSP1324-20130603/5257_1 /TAXON_ID=236786 /ORGANISM="Florenciella sp., Strain RCC1587" /LENGTH=102 /DNA_ID=CAMNT_0024776117 /DNA_START=194 /DNA_END=503 /DNA_ORIENTATION=-
MSNRARAPPPARRTPLSHTTRHRSSSSSSRAHLSSSHATADAGWPLTQPEPQRGPGAVLKVSACQLSATQSGSVSSAEERGAMQVPSTPGIQNRYRSALLHV